MAKGPLQSHLSSGTATYKGSHPDWVLLLLSALQATRKNHSGEVRVSSYILDGTEEFLQPCLSCVLIDSLIP